jgi:Ethanolamine utilization protein EutJ (predicted chaperonin)/outer membrane protein assembly factor BamB
MPEPQQGFAIGVDLGTSNTVAVIRWPDGRTRPLLFDSAPVMRSGVYLDESGRLHAGRDALRMAQLDPARFEPNPKRRIDESTVLLGDREVPTVDLLAALLTAVGRAAVEAVGFLPSAVLTYPAAWGARRRETLASAASRAGWPPPHLVPEPVAAARYFADVLRRPVPVGSSLAVFDFGGGTLDIAVVRNDNGRFVVLGSGGIPDLGGLDVDAAIVEHLGGVLGVTVPDTWHALSTPDTTTQRRDRRLFWEEVRDAKEMLSRTAVAPVTVPGREQAIHLTREELERLADPLLRRAVYETGAVIQRCGLRPDQLAGLFLVGGSSRLPLAARLLHAQLGIAPTVLEQPELPVAEGALAEVAPAAAFVNPVLPPAPVSPPMAPPPMAPPPVSPPVGILPPPPHPPWYRRRIVWIAAAATALVGAIAATVAFLVLPRGVHQVEFDTLRTRVSVPIPDPSKVDGAYTATYGDRAYYGWVTDKQFSLGALDLAGNKKLWEPVRVGLDYDRWRIVALPQAVLVFAEGSSTPGALYAVDPDNGKQKWTTNFESRDQFFYFRDVLVRYQSSSRQLVGVDWGGGGTKWTRPNPKTGSSNDALVVPVGRPDDLLGPATFAGNPVAAPPDDAQLVQVGYDKKIYLVDGAGRDVRKWNNVGDLYDTYYAHDGKLFVATGSAPYQVEAYDLGKLEEPQLAYTGRDPKRRLEAMVACGKGRLCVLDTLSSDAKTTELAAVDVASHRELWRKTAAGTDTLVPVGGSILATSSSGTPASVLYDAAGKQLLADDEKKAYGVRVNAASLLFFSGSLSTYPSGTVGLVGVDATSGQRTSVGSLAKMRSANCSWNDSAIVCPGEEQFQSWLFAKG